MATDTILALPEFEPYQSRYYARALKFGRYRRYYEGTIYDDTAFKLAHKLYAQTKSLVAFIARTVDLDVALIPGMMEPWELDPDATPQGIIDARDLLYAWSQWPVESDAWLEDGTMLGEAMLKIVPSESMVKVQRLRPETAMLLDHIDPDSGEPVQMLLIVDRSMTDSTGKSYEYAEAITPGQIRTYRNGDPWGYGGNPDRYDNPLGFVPAIRTPCDVDCRPTFSPVLPQLNSVNEMASYISDIIGRHAEPQWAAIGAEASDLTKSGGNIWFFPQPDASLQAIIAQIDIPGTLAFIESFRDEMKSNLPELAFDELRAQKLLATETLHIQLIELRAKIWKMRRRFDAGLIQAHQMAAIAAGIYGIGDLAPLLAPHSMDYARPVLPRSRMEEIQLEEAELALEAARQMATGEGMTRAAVGAVASVEAA